MNKIPYGRQNIEQNDVEAVVKALIHAYLTQGPSVVEFENKFNAVKFPQGFEYNSEEDLRKLIVEHVDFNFDK